MFSESLVLLAKFNDVIDCCDLSKCAEFLARRTHSGDDFSDPPFAIGHRGSLNSLDDSATVANFVFYLRDVPVMGVTIYHIVLSENTL